MQGFSRIFQHLEHFLPLAFFTKIFTLSTPSNLNNLSLSSIGLAFAVEVIKYSDKFTSLTSFKYSFPR